LAKINVDTGALRTAAGELLIQSDVFRAAADTVTNTAAVLDWVISAAPAIDQRLKSHGSMAHHRADELRRRSQHLKYAADAYERAEAQILREIVRLASMGAVAGVSGGGGGGGAGGGVGGWGDIGWLASIVAGLKDPVTWGSRATGFIAKYLGAIAKAEGWIADIAERFPGIGEMMGWVPKDAEGIAGTLAPWVGKAQAWGAALSVVGGVITGAEEYFASSGSQVRRISNGVVVGLAAAGGAYAGGAIGAQAGGWIGGVIGTAICPGAGTIVGAAIGQAVGALGGGWIGGEASKWVVKLGGDGSVEHATGNAAEGAWNWLTGGVRAVASSVSGGGLFNVGALVSGGAW
jgi:hypothetical protein